MRARNLKPGFFQNEQLAELPIPARLLFAGLWLMADREGRLEDRPRRIKIHLFPADDLDIEPLLAGLAEQRLIVRYRVGEAAYIWIPRFLEHQNPHPRETASVIPPCPPEMFHVLPKAVPRTDQGKPKVVSSPAESLFSESLNPESSPSGRERASRASRLPEDFVLTSERRAVAEAEKLPAERVFEKFCNYWRAKSGQQARKHDWDATWRNWCLTEADRSRGNGAPLSERKTTWVPPPDDEEQPRAS